MAKFRILSIDGGGLRGIVPVLILKEIERRTGKRITELFDMIAGTSTGGLMAVGLTVSSDGKTPMYSLSDIEQVYKEQGKAIFPEKNLLGSIINNTVALKNPKYSADGLQQVLDSLLANKRISDCILPIFITSFDLYNNEAVLFKYRQAITDASANARLVDICRATSAAPTYLPAYDFTFKDKKRICIDGGVYMNNPSLGALIEIMKYHKEAPYNVENLKLDDIAILSLGTGYYSPEIARKKVEDWGLLDWATTITDVMMQAVNQTTTYETKELISAQNFLRLDLEINNLEFYDMADSSNKAQAYLTRETKTQLFENSTLMNQLDLFLKSSQEKNV